MNHTFRLIFHIAVRDIKERYAASSVGVLWSFIYPIFFIIIYWFVFSKIMHVKGISPDIPFLPFLLSGLFPWFAIQEGIIKGTSSIIERGYIIKKMPIPNEIFPIASNISAFFHHSIGFSMFLIIYFINYGFPSFINILTLPALAFMQIIFSIGCSLLLSSITVYFRDIVQIITIALQGIFFLVPIFYPLSAIPDKFRLIVQINPITNLVEGYRSIIIFNKMPDLFTMLYCAVISIIVTAIGYVIFSRLKHGFADTL
jgi:lipopolysaccharide transport system permease protein